MADWRYDFDPNDESDDNTFKRWRAEERPMPATPTGRRAPTFALLLAALGFILTILLSVDC